MDVDPRLIHERKRQIEEKEMKQKQREQDVLDKKRQEGRSEIGGGTTNTRRKGTQGSRKAPTGK